MDRRTFLGLACVVAAPAVAGCSDGRGTRSPTTATATGRSGSPTDTPTSTPSATPTASEPATETGTPTERETPTETATATPTARRTETTTVTPEGAADVAASNYAFDPVRVRVAPGGTVTWTNQASGQYAAHTVVAAQFHDVAASWSFDERLGGGESTSHTFENPGVYEYYCDIHGASSMCGAVLVGGVSLDETLPCEE